MNFNSQRLNFNNPDFKNKILFWFDIKYRMHLQKGEEANIYSLPVGWLDSIIKDFNENFNLKPQQFEQPYTDIEMYDDIACYVCMVEGIGWLVYRGIAADINNQDYYSKHVKDLAKTMKHKINYLE